jgi:hypothetical protein
MKAFPLFQHFQGNLVRIFDRVFHIPVIHLEGDWKQRAREMIENRDRIFSFHLSSLVVCPRNNTAISGQDTNNAFGPSNRTRALSHPFCSAQVRDILVGEPRLRRVQSHMRASILVLALTFGCLELSFGWGAEGHRAVATLAQELISARTQAKVQQLLNESGDIDLAAASTWADEVREKARPNRPRPKDAEAFNRQFPNNASWHYINLPLGTDSFVVAKKFIHGENNVIFAIEHCIAVLEAPVAVAEDLSRTQALRLLVHLVGDVHQPLHCGTGFYRLNETEPPVLVTNPDEIANLPNDRGGNDLFYGPKEELHALWDIGLVAEIADSFDFRALDTVLRKEYLDRSWPPTAGDYHHWAETWALESVEVANDAYAGIRFNSYETMGDPNSLWISITLPTGYVEQKAPRAAEQLTKAAVRLAQLLDRLSWP